MSLLRSAHDVLWTYAQRASLARRTATLQAPDGDRRTLWLVSWGFPPFYATGMHLPTSFARDAAALGWRVSVLCSPAPASPIDAGMELLQSLPPDVGIMRVPERLGQDMELAIAPSTRVTPAINGHFVTALAMARHGLARIATDPPGVIVASGPRFSNFVAACYLAEALGPRCKLVLCYRDEWTVNPLPFLPVSDDDRRWEERCLRRADLVVFVTQGKHEASVAAFPFLAAKPCHVIPNGWSSTNHQDDGPVAVRTDPGEFVLSFVGRAAGHLPIAPFLTRFGEALDRRPDLARRLRLLLVGDQPMQVLADLDRFERSHPGVLRRHGVVSAREATRWQAGSDALLLLANSTHPGIVPLKLFDYMRSDRPILGFGERSEAAAIVRATEAGVVVPDDDTACLIRALEQLMASDPCAYTNPARTAWAEAHRRDRLNARLLHLIETLGQGDASAQARHAMTVLEASA